MAQAPLAASIFVALGAVCFSFMSLFAKKAGTQGHLSCFVLLAVRSLLGLFLNWGAVFITWVRTRGAEKAEKSMTTGATLTPAHSLRRGSTGSKASVDSEVANRAGTVCGLSYRAIKWLTVRAFAGFGCVLLEYAALKVLPLKVNAMIIYSSPAFIVLWAAILLREPVKAAVVALQMVSFGGLTVVVRPWTLGQDGSAPIWAYVAAVIATSLAGLVYVSLRALAGTSYLTVMNTFLTTCLVFSVSVALPLGEFNLPGADQPQVWGYLVAVGVFAYMAEVFVTCGYQRAGAGTGQVSVLKFLSPVFSMLWACLFLGEEIEWTDMAGAVLILGSSATIVLLQAKSHKNVKGGDCSPKEVENPDIANPTFDLDLEAEADNPTMEDLENPEAQEFEAQKQQPSFCLSSVGEEAAAPAERASPEEPKDELQVSAV